MTKTRWLPQSSSAAFGISFEPLAWTLSLAVLFLALRPTVAEEAPSRLPAAPPAVSSALPAAAATTTSEPRLEASSVPLRPGFETDVVPLLTRHGCNGGGCHGKSTGQNGFRLSLLGYEPAFDHESLTREARGRRLFLAAPRRSLLLLKATGALPHGGGARFAVDSPDYLTLERWIASGAPPASAADPQLESLTIVPASARFEGTQRDVALRVEARFTDGSRRDVTALSIFQSNEPEIAEVDDSGHVAAKQRSGLFTVMVRYGEKIGLFHGVAPRPGDETVQRELEHWASQPELSTIDRLLAAQWRRLGIAPSPMASDGEFLRRASLDICGTLPTPAELAAYTADTRPDKRARLIASLLERPDYASYFALKWADILRNRGRGYATSKQRHGTALFAAWIRDSLAANVPYDEFAAAILTASGSQETNPPTVWYRNVRTQPDYVESIAQAFLGVRIQCAQCHHHPADRWSQDDYYGLAAVFERVGRKGGFADAEVPTNETIYLAASGRTLHPRSGRQIAPRPLGGPDFNAADKASGRFTDRFADRFTDPRKQLAEWMASPDNPFFARTMANRLWGHFFGRGIIHPIDDARPSNPPSNPELLDYLARDFSAHGFDIKRLIHTICSSNAYALSSLPSDANRDDSQNFARYYPKRMSAEVLLDALSQTLDAPTRFPNVSGEFPVGTRAIELPDEAVPSQFLDVFGRPARMSACECERVDAPALGQTLELVSSKEIHQKLTHVGGFVDRLAQSHRPELTPTELETLVETNVQSLFLRLLSRPPTTRESRAASDFLRAKQEAAMGKQPDTQSGNQSGKQSGKQSGNASSKPADICEAYRSLTWALLATNEFLFNH
jgi:hypothetical protein